MSPPCITSSFKSDLSLFSFPQFEFAKVLNFFQTQLDKRIIEQSESSAL